MEETPADEAIKCSAENLVRDHIFSKDAPPPDFSIDCDPIETRKSVLNRPLHLGAVRPRPENVGIIAIELSTSGDHPSSETNQDLRPVASDGMHLLWSLFLFVMISDL